MLYEGSSAPAEGSLGSLGWLAHERKTRQHLEVYPKLLAAHVESLE